MCHSVSHHSVSPITNVDQARQLVGEALDFIGYDDMPGQLEVVEEKLQKAKALLERPLQPCSLHKL